MLQPVDDCVGVRGVYDQPIVGRQPIDQHVIQYPAIRTTHETVANLVFGKVGYFVGQDTVQEGGDGVAGKVEDAHVADVEEPDRAAHRLVFRNHALVLDRHFPARKGHYPRACFDVGLKEGCTLELHSFLTLSTRVFS